jgi:hypothetical protein
VSANDDSTSPEVSVGPGWVRLETVLTAFDVALAAASDPDGVVAAIVRLVRDEAITTEADEILIRHLRASPRLATGSQIGYFLESRFIRGPVTDQLVGLAHAVIGSGNSEPLNPLAFGLTNSVSLQGHLATRLVLLDELASVVIERSDTVTAWLIIQRCTRHRTAVPDLDRVLWRLVESLEPAEADRVVPIALTEPSFLPGLVAWLEARARPPGPRTETLLSLLARGTPAEAAVLEASLAGER